MESPTKPKIPEQWPPEVADRFEPIRPLGCGGFSNTTLARRKAGVVIGVESDYFVCIKLVGSKDATINDVGYAHREIEILSELRHPNIMRLLGHWEPPLMTHKCAAVMALSYHDGPTADNLLKVGGRFSFLFTRVIMAQLVEAIAYLHTRAVIHRDIKPDNLIVTGATAQQAEIWDDKMQETDADWSFLTKKWHVTVVDFGFARALTPADMHQKELLLQQQQLQSSARCVSDPEPSCGSKTSLGDTGGNLSQSISHKFKKQMSALGNRAYAAPDITKNIDHCNVSATPDETADVTKTLSSYVSEYGIMVDAYSLGSTMKYFLTGIPPDQDMNEFLAFEKSPLVVLCRWICASSPCRSHSSLERRRQYRGLNDINGEAKRLLVGLLNANPMYRTSVRLARRYPYIDEVVDRGRNINASQVEYLKCALEPFAVKSTTY